MNIEWYLVWPHTWSEWALWALWGGILVAIAWHWRPPIPRHTLRQRVLGGLLLCAAAPLAVLVGHIAQHDLTLPAPGLPGVYTVIWAPLSALPWWLAAGWLGPLGAVVVAICSGLTRALAFTHTPTTLWVEVSLAYAAAWAFHQPYRTRFFRLLRQPLFTWLPLSLVALVGQLAEMRVDLGAYWRPLLWAWGYRVAEMFIAAVVTTPIRRARWLHWGATREDEPSPVERGLVGRFMARSLPVYFVVALGILTVTLVGGYQFAEEQMTSRMAVLVRTAAEGVPYFLDQGQFWIETLSADTQRPVQNDPAAWRAWLQQATSHSALFTTLLVVDEHGELLAWYTVSDESGGDLTPDERTAVTFALAGVPYQVITSPAPRADRAAWITFVKRMEGEPTRVLLGRADLSVSPQAKGITRSLQVVEELGGQAFVLDARGNVLYPQRVAQFPFSVTTLKAHSGRMQKVIYANGQRYGLLAWPTLGRDWWVVVLVPYRLVREQVLQGVYRITLLLLAAYAVLFLGLKHTLGRVIASLITLTEEAQRIAGGDLDHALETTGEDEVAHLRRAFEYMRRKLKARLEELRRLLQVSQRVASSTQVEAAVWPVLEAAQAVEPLPMAVRVVLTEEALVEPTDRPWPAFGVGPQAAGLAYLDEQILGLTRQQDLVVLPWPQRMRMLRLRESGPLPKALIAVALRYEGRHYGALYLAFEQMDAVPSEVIQYERTLAGQLSLALANARLLESIQLGKQRLEAILAASPDPILVLDDRGRLLLANPAAMAALALDTIPLRAKVEELVASADLRALLRRPGEGPFSEEVNWPDGRVFFATVVGVEGRRGRMGRVCVLRDITRFKELDTLKSEFVQTVSHDLRSPLTLVHGYATMLEMVGPLNERQKRYVRQIIHGVEHMTRLVNNLLDLGRIEAGLALQLQMVPVEDWVRQTVQSLEAKAMQKRIRLEVDIAPDAPPLIEADLGLLERALQNLVDNAIKYTPPEGRVTVRVRPVGMDRVQIAVEDTGVGIAPVDQPRLFEKFYRVARREVRQEQGSGLGLAIVRSVVERHHGRIWVESRLGHGSVFTMELPLRQPAMTPET